MSNKKVFNEIKICGNKSIKIFEGKGRDFNTALALSGGKKESFTLHLAAILSEIEGEKVSFQELEDLPIRDYTKILTEVGKQLGEE